VPSGNKVAVLLATYNGLNWLKDQLESLLSQQDVDITLFISDDCSSDGTFEHVTQLSKFDTRIIVLPKKERMGSAGRNFYRLILEVDLKSFDYVAFSDQDDIWNLDKLSRHVQLIKKHKAEAISSNVLAFWPDGHQKLIVKSQSQKKYDFLFESAGPGCTFLMTPWLVGRVKHHLITSAAAKNVELHDWLIYAICRAHNKQWIIDAVPSILYRQHNANVVGANSGIRPGIARLKKIKEGWYRHQIALISRVVISINQDTKLSTFQKIIQSNRFIDHLRLVPFALKGRRKLIDRFVLVLSVLFFVF